MLAYNHVLTVSSPESILVSVGDNISPESIASQVLTVSGVEAEALAEGEGVEIVHIVEELVDQPPPAKRQRSSTDEDMVVADALGEEQQLAF